MRVLERIARITKMRLMCLIVATAVYYPCVRVDANSMNPATSVGRINIISEKHGHSIGPVMPPGPSVDCTELVPRPVDVSPMRSPQKVHSFIATYIRGKSLVEFGTRNGDGMACFAQVARTAVAIEVDAGYCKNLASRSVSHVPNVPHFTVLCRSYQAGVPDADVYMWWMGGKHDNEVLKYLLGYHAAGKIHATAEAIVLVDTSMPEDRESWARMRTNATWHVRIPFDERRECLKRKREGLCSRAHGYFIVAGIPIGRSDTANPVKSVSIANNSSNGQGYSNVPVIPTEELPFDCTVLVPSPLDVSPMRSPQKVHSMIASYVRGKSLVEFVTRNGDGMACFVEAARTAVAFEPGQGYCNKLKSRSSAQASARNLKVLCRSYQAGVPDADVYTWWQQTPHLTDSEVLKYLRVQQAEGKIRATAEAVILVDTTNADDLKSWAIIRTSAAWHVNIAFDERDECQKRKREGLCSRAHGEFIVAGVPLQAGPA